MNMNKQNLLLSNKKNLNDISSECSKVTEKKWLGKMIYLKLCEKLTFASTIKWYRYKVGYVLENHHHYHHHHVVPLERIFLTLSRHSSLSLIALGRSSGLHPVSSHSYCMYVRAGRPTFAWPYLGVHRSTSLMSSSLLLRQCPACLVRLTCIVFVMGGKWPYSWCLVGCCRQDLFNIALNIHV